MKRCTGDCKCEGERDAKKTTEEEEKKADEQKEETKEEIEPAPKKARTSDENKTEEK